MKTAIEPDPAALIREIERIRETYPADHSQIPAIDAQIARLKSKIKPQKSS